jgi:hypothetical protein
MMSLLTLHLLGARDGSWQFCAEPDLGRGAFAARLAQCKFIPTKFPQGMIWITLRSVAPDTTGSGPATSAPLNFDQKRKKLERFPAKWMPVRVKKTRQNKRLELRSDSIGTEKALAAGTILVR